MAINLKRLVNVINSSNSILNPISLKSYNQLSLLKHFISSFTTHRNFSSCSACVTGHKPSEDVIDDERDYDGFLKWHKGGGMFHKSANIDPTAFIDFGAVVHSEALVGGNVHVGSGSVVGPNVSIGKSTKIGIWFVFGRGWGMVKKPQSLKVHVGNNVEIGANSCVDMVSWRDTMIGDDTKIDNLVQIGHNVVIGKCCMLYGQVGIAGSVTMGDYVTLGGRVGVCDHVTIVSKVRLAAASCVTKDITKPGDYGGFPTVPIREWRRQIANRCQSLK